MTDKLRASDYRFIAICLLLLGVTVWFSVQNFHRAFPEASIDFRFNREDGRSIAARFLAQQGYAIPGYREASSFTFDENAKTFLERVAGLEQANRIMGGRVRIWRWSYRWFRPLQKEEFRADVTPRGEFVGFEHLIAEDAPRPDASAAEARTLAERFLTTRMGRELASLEFVEESDVTRPNRVDRVFTWKERDFELRDATNRVAVTILGNEVAGYHEYLKVPDQWIREYQRLRSKNEVASTVDSAVAVALAVGLIVVIVMRVRRQDIRWREAALIGMIGMILAFLAQLNQMPLQEFEYPTTDSYGSFMSRQFLQAILSALGSGGLLFILAAGAEPLYREAFAGQVSLGNLFRPQGLRTKRFLLGSILGISLTGIFIAYQTAFYMIAYRFGAWSPADVPYSDLLNTKFPWAFVLFGGFLPAVSEEFLFRMFAIPFLRKLVRSMAAALILAGFIWGFGHSAYPQQPFYIRGVEVGIGGIALGIIMLRWGILPTLVWHYSVDAMYSAMLLLRSQSLYFKLSGAAAAGIVVLPVVIALVAYWRRGGFASEAGLLNADEPAPVDPPVLPEALPAAIRDEAPPTSARRWIAALALLAAGVGTLAVPVQRFGESPSYKLDRNQARSASDQFVRARGLDPNAFRNVTFPENHAGGDDAAAAKYFLQRLPVRDASALFERYRPVHFWASRYFKSLDKEEILVSIHPETGKVMGFQHTLAEDTPGADLSDDDARQVGAAFAQSQGFDLSSMELKESRSEKKKARRDHTMVWEARPGDPRNAGDTRFRVEVEVAGDRVSALRSFWKLPEAFARARTQQNIFSITTLAMNIGVIAGTIVCAIGFLIHSIRAGTVRWKSVIRAAIPLALLSAVDPALSFRQMLQGYPTAIPLETFEALMYIIVAMSVIFGFLIVGGALALETSSYPDVTRLLQAGYRRVWRSHTLTALLAAIGLGMLVRFMQGWMWDRFHANALVSAANPALLVSAAPAIAAMASGIRTVVIYGALAATAGLIVQHLRKQWIIVPLALATAFVFVPSGVRTAGEFALYYSMGAIAVSALAAFSFGFARRNLLAYAIVFWILALRGPMSQLLGNPNPSYVQNGWILAAVAILTTLWAVLPLGSGNDTAKDGV